MSALRRYNRATLKPELIDEGPNAAWTQGYYGSVARPDSTLTGKERHRLEVARHKAKRRAEGKP